MDDIRYIRLDIDPGPAPGFAVKVISAILGSANPSFEEAHERVTYWWLEIDKDGRVLREIGFDADGQIVAIAPIGRNYGVVTDSGYRIEASASDVDMSTFIDTWQAAERAFAA